MTDNNALAQELGPWECFRDDSYYDMWCVRCVHDRTFGHGFHLVQGDEAAALRDLLNTYTPAPAPVGGDVVEALKDVLASLLAAHSLLSRSPKTAAPSDKMFDQMLKDYEKSIERGRKAYTALQAQPAPAQGDDVVELDWATAFEKAAAKTARLEQELNIANADHIALWLEANTIPDEPMSQCISWLACRIVEAHERALAAMPPKVEAPAVAEVRELAHKLRGVAAPVAAADITSSSWVYEIQYGPEGESNYAHVFASDGRLIAVMKVTDAAKIAAIRSGGAS